MHPLWEEYRWPTKDANDEDVPTIEDQDKFYVNLYSGEISLDFPVQEQNCLGGILADEMGLGKTIEMFSLIHSHKSPEAIAAAAETITSVNQLPRLASTSGSVQPAPCTTLVVAPMSLLAQWESEAIKSSTAGSLKTLVYYGNDKGANLPSICSAANAASAPNSSPESLNTFLDHMVKKPAIVQTEQEARMLRHFVDVLSRWFDVCDPEGHGTLMKRRQQQQYHCYTAPHFTTMQGAAAPPPHYRLPETLEGVKSR